MKTNANERFNGIFIVEILIRLLLQEDLFLLPPVLILIYTSNEKSISNPLLMTNAQETVFDPSHLIKRNFLGNRQEIASISLNL